MALARTYAMALAGVQGHVVEIEADIENGLPALFLVGLPDTALREARDRIRSAIVNEGRSWPMRRVTVGLSPASLPKRGSAFDVAIAVAILAADEVVTQERIAGTVFIGELGLDGRLRPVPGVLPSVAGAAATGFGRVVVPPENAPEALLVPGMEIVSVPSLGALVGWLQGEPDVLDTNPAVQVLQSGAGQAPAAVPAAATGGLDLADVVGQPVARRAAEICAAGGHHMLLLGPPGVGKPMLEIKHTRLASSAVANGSV
jgi:magnesium chelatase family protein